MAQPVGKPGPFPSSARACRCRQNSPGRARKEEVLLVRYEDLVSSPVATMQRVAAHVGLNRDVGVITTIVERYAAASVKTPEIRKALHLSDGPKGKKIESFSPDERAMLDQRLGPILGSMSY